MRWPASKRIDRARGGRQSGRVTDNEIIAFIRANLPLAAIPSIPEISLHRAQASSRIGRLAEADDRFGTPYWAYLWGGGLALARFLLDHPETVAGRRVLDLGSGSGLVAIAAAKSGAASVLAVDVDPFAVVATTLNAAANGASITSLQADATTNFDAEAEVVLVGDLFYDAALAVAVAAQLDSFLERGAVVLVGDPWRSPLPRDRLRTLREYRVAETGEIANQPSAVFTYLREPA